MSIQDLGSIGELIAALATIGTLIYLAIQIKANTNSMATASRQAVANEFRDFNRLNLEYPHEWVLGLNSYPEIEFESRTRFASIFHDLLLFFQSAQALFESGNLDEGTYYGYLTFLATCIRTPGGRSFWEEWRTTYTPEMVAAIDNRIQDESLPNLLDKAMNQLDESRDA